MLNVLRESFKESSLLKWILALVAVSMIGYLGSYFFDTSAGGGTGGRWAARVNGEEIPARRFLGAARNVDNYYRQMFGSSYEQMSAQIRPGAQAIQMLVEEEVIVQDARRLGLSASPAAIAARIRSSPEFIGPGGEYIGDAQVKEAVKRGFDGGYDAYERTIERDVLQAQWTNLVTQPVVADDDEVRELFRERTEKTAIDYVVVAAAEREIDETVTDAQLAAFHADNGDRYQRGPGSRVRYVVIDRDTQRAALTIDEADIRAYYEANTGDYAHPEQRQASHILLRADASADDATVQAALERAEGILERARGGESFETLARTLSEDPVSAEAGGDLGWFGRGQMVAPFEEAAFSTAVGELSPVVRSPFGFHVILVTDSRAAGSLPMEEVADTIRSTLELQRAQERVASEAERIRAALTDPAQFETVAAAEELEIRSRFVPERGQLRDIGAGPDFVLAVAALDPGEISAPLQIAAGRAIVLVDETLDASVAPLADVRDRVRDDLLAARRVDSAVKAAREALDRGKALDRAATRLKLEKAASGDLAPGGTLPAAGGPSAALDEALFAESTAIGTRGVVEVPAGALIYEVTDRVPFDPARFEAEQDEIRAEVLARKRSSFRRALVSRLRGEQQVEINRVMVAEVDGQS